MGHHMENVRSWLPLWDEMCKAKQSRRRGRKERREASLFFCFGLPSSLQSAGDQIAIGAQYRQETHTSK